MIYALSRCVVRVCIVSVADRWMGCIFYESCRYECVRLEYVHWFLWLYDIGCVCSKFKCSVLWLVRACTMMTGDCVASVCVGSACVEFLRWVFVLWDDRIVSGCFMSTVMSPLFVRLVTCEWVRWILCFYGCVCAVMYYINSHQLDRTYILWEAIEVFWTLQEKGTLMGNNWTVLTLRGNNQFSGLCRWLGTKILYVNDY